MFFVFTIYFLFLLVGLQVLFTVDYINIYETKKKKKEEINKNVTLNVYITVIGFLLFLANTINFVYTDLKRISLKTL